MFSRIKYLFNSKEIDNFWICSSVQTINLYRFLGYLSIHSHQSAYRQNAKTDEAYQPKLFHCLDEKGDLCFSRRWEFFQHDFHHNNLTKKYMNIVFISNCFSLQNIS